MLASWSAARRLLGDQAATAGRADDRGIVSANFYPSVPAEAAIENLISRERSAANHRLLSVYEGLGDSQRWQVMNIMSSIVEHSVSIEGLSKAPRLSRTKEKLREALVADVGRAVCDYSMIEDGDLIMCAVSGGVDSMSMLTLLGDLQRRAPIDFKIIAVNLDQKQPGFPADVLPRYFTGIGVDYRIIEQDTYSIVKEKIPEGKTMCSLCSRLRRGILYRVASELGATKIALGHHLDDIVETLFLNMFFGGQMKAMPPKLRSDDGRNVVIRPLAYCEKKDIQKFGTAMEYPIIPCTLCGSQSNSQRLAVRKMIAEWEAADPRRKGNIFRSIQNLRPSQLADRSLFDFSLAVPSGMNHPNSSAGHW